MVIAEFTKIRKLLPAFYLRAFGFTRTNLSKLEPSLQPSVLNKIQVNFCQILINSTILCLILWLPLSARTLTLINDSPYHLTAKVYNAQGTLVATVPIDRGATGYYDYNQGAFSPEFNTQYALYTVRWFCRGTDRPYDYSQPKKDEKPPEFENEYASWPNVGPGSTVNAQASPNGTHQCVTKKKQPQTGKKGEKSDEEPPTPDAQQNEKFLNDGGMDWSNNGAPGASGGEVFPKTGDLSAFQTSPSRWKNN